MTDKPPLAPRQFGDRTGGPRPAAAISETSGRARPQGAVRALSVPAAPRPHLFPEGS